MPAVTVRHLTNGQGGGRSSGSGHVGPALQFALCIKAPGLHNRRLVATEQPFNRLWEFLDARARADLSPVAVHLRSRERLYEAGTPTLYVYFPVTAVISLVSTMENGASAEVAVVGREGMVGLSSVLGTVEGATAAVVQVAGSAVRVPAALLRQQRLQSPSVRAVVDLYTEARLIQVAQTAACNSLHSVEARLARWLLAIADRIDAESFTLSQEFMAQMIGVQRPTVSLALQRLRQAGTVVYQGRSIKVADRQGLERRACECHSVLRREFERILRRPAAESLAPLHGGAERFGNGPPMAAALAMMREITGRLLLATIHEHEARDEAVAAVRAKDQFLAMVSHELRTPLNAILGWSAMLSERPEQPLERGLTVIRRNARALLTLVDELLDAAQVGAERISVRPSPIDLREVVCSAVDAVRPSADLKGVSLRTTVDAFPTMMGDPDRLRQVLLNVLSNALKFTEAGGTIDVCAAVAGERARVSIRDSGCGIAADELPYVFERFRQGADATAVHHGLGLGLTIARVLVELHGGTIEIVSPGHGQGTSCTIELPITASPTAADSSPDPASARL
jgi:signal transduction histidine kinase